VPGLVPVRARGTARLRSFLAKFHEYALESWRMKPVELRKAGEGFDRPFRTPPGRTRKRESRERRIAYVRAQAAQRWSVALRYSSLAEGLEEQEEDS